MKRLNPDSGVGTEIACGPNQAVDSLSIIFGIALVLLLSGLPLYGQQVDPAVNDQIALHSKARVLILLKEPNTGKTVNFARLYRINEMQRRVLSRIHADDIRNVHQWKAISGLSGEITARGLASLANDPDILRIDLDRPGKADDSVSSAVIRASTVQASGFRGEGTTVAVLDTGVYSGHEDLSAAVVAEQCFCMNSDSSGCCPNASTAQSGPGSARDDHGHGTNVAGIIASAGTSAPLGIAPDAKIVAVRVMDSSGVFSGTTQIMNALDWVLTHRPDVKVVNMSLGTYARFEGDCDSAWPTFASAFNLLRAAGIAVFASSANNSDKVSMSAPACFSNVTAVGSVENRIPGSQISTFSNSNTSLDLLAPGCYVVSTGTGSPRAMSMYCGTSQASPHAAGAAALLLQAKPAITPAEITDVLQRSGIYLLDEANNVVTPRIDLVPAMSMILNGQSFLNDWLYENGAYTGSTSATAASTRAGYATVGINKGADPYGTAVFGLRQNGAVISEAGVPASALTTRARIFIEFRSGVKVLPGISTSGTVDVNTGLAVVNYGWGDTTIYYTLRDMSGTQIAAGQGTLNSKAYFACFIDQLQNTAAPGFVLPSNFRDDIQFATLEISSYQPLSLVALRGTMNQRHEYLLTTTPVVDMSGPPASDPLYFPQFADGGGYTTSLALLNRNSAEISGNLQILDDNGNPIVVTQVGGTSDSSFRYSIPADGVFRFQTDGFPANVKTGWVRVIPDPETTAPVGSGVFSYNPGSVLLSETGIPSSVATTHAHVHVDLSANHNTGLAIANVQDSPVDVWINAYESDGVTPAGSTQGPISLNPNGHETRFADQFITGLPPGFRGVLDIQATTSFAALTLRSLMNERHEFLMTTFPVADMIGTAPHPIVFPQIVDGGGYKTEVILLGSTAGSSITLDFHAPDGGVLPVAKCER